MRRLALLFLVAASLTACDKKNGEAVVLEKEHIDAATPFPSTTPTSTATDANRPIAEPSTTEGPDEREERELAADEIVVDAFVMKKEVRGTSKDPRASSTEQWRVSVRMIEGGREFTIHTDRAHYDKVKPGDRIKVRYKTGKYTGTVWDSEIVD